MTSELFFPVVGKNATNFCLISHLAKVVVVTGDQPGMRLWAEDYQIDALLQSQSVKNGSIKKHALQSLSRKPPTQPHDAVLQAYNLWIALK